MLGANPSWMLMFSRSSDSKPVAKVLLFFCCPCCCFWFLLWWHLNILKQLPTFLKSPFHKNLDFLLFSTKRELGPDQVPARSPMAIEGQGWTAAPPPDCRSPHRAARLPSPPAWSPLAAGVCHTFFFFSLSLECVPWRSSYLRLLPPFKET